MINGHVERSIVHIKVDNDHREYLIHETLLSEISPYFKAALGPGRNESHRIESMKQKRHVDERQVLKWRRIDVR